MTRIRILIVDDKQENLYMLRALLTGYGCEVEEARHGAEALTKARELPPNLVISDLLMPVMDGYTLLRHWKSDERLRLVPFVVYTATYTGPKDEQLARNLGADAFIIKPAEPDQFMAGIQEVLTRRKDGLLSPAKLPSGDEEVQLKQYSESLIRKLEKKAFELERVNQALEEYIAERRRAEDALHRSTSLLHAAFDATTDGILAVDREGRIIASNRKFAEMWHVPKTVMDRADEGELRACLMEQLKDPEGFAAKIEALYNEPAKESRDIVEFKDGRVFERFSRPQRMGEEIVGRVWDFRDITESRQAEAEREKLQAQLVQAQKMESVGRLAGGVAHDFNNMLGVILGYAEMALTNLDPSLPLYSNIVQIHKAAGRSAEITRQLLAFARKQTISPQVLNLNETVEGMLKMLRRLIEENIDLVWQPRSGLWLVKMDPSQIDQILANLCVNARDAIAGTGKLTIQTGMATFDEAFCAGNEGSAPGDYVLLAVSDDGCGMGPETLSHLFEPFFTTKAVGKGTGLGLATVYGIVTQNNGFINVASEPEKGTIFKIYLPRYEEAVETAIPQDLEQPARGNGETVLLVEDNAALLELVRKMLTGLGYRILEASSPALALKRAGEHPGAIDLLITDVVMPEMNGRALAERLAALHPGLKVLFMSGFTSDAIAHHGVLDDGIHFIQKPFSMRNISRKVREALGGG